MYKKILYLGAIALLIGAGACSKGMSTEEKKDKTENVINKMGTSAQRIENAKGIKALSSMPSDAPITDAMATLDKVATTHKLNVPILKLNVKIKDITPDSLYGTWEYDAVNGWVKVSPEPNDGVILQWSFMDENGQTHNAVMSFFNITWDSNEYITSCTIELKVDGEAEFTASYSVSMENGHPIRANITLEYTNLFKMEVRAEAVEGHTLDEDELYGTASIKFTDYVENLVYIIEYTHTTANTYNIKLTFTSGDESWEISLTISGNEENPEITGYIKMNGETMATIVTENGMTYVVYDDNTKVDLNTYLAQYGFSTNG